MVKIAFLFLTISSVYHEHLWRDFFEGNQEQYSIYAHAKNPLPESDFLYPYRIAETVPTSWSNTMRAQIALLKEALTDPDNEKFIFVSESTIPLARFDTMYKKVTETPHSIFMYYPNPHLVEGTIFFNKARHLDPIPPELQYKNYQWVVLSRKHAQLMVEDTYYISIIEKHALDNEHYESTFLACQGLLAEIHQKSMTYVYWPAHVRSPHPYSFVNFEDPAEFSRAAQAVSRGYLFMRKIDKNCILAPLEKILPYYNQTRSLQKAGERVSST